METENLRKGPALRRVRRAFPFLWCPIFALCTQVTVLHAQTIVAGENRARLTFSVKGALLEATGKTPRRFRSLAEIVQGIPGGRGEFVVATEGSAAVSPEGTLAAKPGLQGKAVRIAEGEIPALELARFLADHTGVPVIYESSDTALAQKTIVIPATIEQAGYDLVKKILETNGFRVSEWKTREGEPALLLESTTAATGPREPVERPIVVLNQPERGGVQTPRSGARRRSANSDSRKYAGLVLSEVPDMLRAQVDLGEGRGVLVDEVNRELTAGSRDIAAFRLYDIVTHVDDVRISTAAQFVRTFNAMKPGHPFQARVLRKGLTRILRGEKTK